MNKSNFMSSRRFAYIALAMGLIGFAMKFTTISTYDGYLIAEFPDLIQKWNYLGFFTYTTNIMVDFWLVLIGLATLFKNSIMRDFLAKASVQGFLTVMIFVVGAIYCCFMIWFDELFSWSLWWGNMVNIWHHMVMPAFMMFLFFRPADRRRLGGKDLGLWTIYPIAYLVVTLVRGGIVNWYPYPFFDRTWETFADIGIDPRLGICIAIVFVTVFIISTSMLAIKIHNKLIEKETSAHTRSQSREAEIT